MRRVIGRLLSGICLVAAFAATTVTQAGFVFVSVNVPGEFQTEPWGITNTGVISGSVEDSASGNFHGFTAQGGNYTTVDVPALVGSGTLLFAGNDNGLFAGEYSDGNGLLQGFVYNGVNQTFTYLPPADPTQQANGAGAVNNSGLVFGNWSNDPSNYTNLVGYSYQLGAGGRYTAFFTAPGSVAANGGTYTEGANNLGTSVGTYFDASGNENGYVRLANGSISTLDFPGAAQTILNSVNDNGEMVGQYFDVNGIGHGFTYINGIFATVDVPGAPNTAITGVDDKGDVVGYTYSVGPGAADPINGFIGYATPEPATITLAVIGALCAAGMTRLRRVKL